MAVLESEQVKAMEVAALLQAVAKGYYDRELEAETLLWYYEDLREFEPAQIGRALRLHVRTPGRCRWFPKPGDLIELMRGAAPQMAEEAWRTVEKAIRTEGRYATVRFEDAQIGWVLAGMGGWVRACGASDQREFDSLRQEFQRAYTARLQRMDRPPGAEASAPLPGLVAQARLGMR